MVITDLNGVIAIVELEPIVDQSVIDSEGIQIKNMNDSSRGLLGWKCLTPPLSFTKEVPSGAFEQTEGEIGIVGDCNVDKGYIKNVRKIIKSMGCGKGDIAYWTGEKNNPILVKDNKRQWGIIVSPCSRQYSVQPICE
jgi:hypothetical protein